MLIDLTVRGPDGDRDVRLDLPAGATFGAVRPDLVRCAEVPVGSRFFLDETELTDGTTLMTAGLRSGAVLTLEPAPSARAAHPYWLRVAGGAGAGHVHALRRGRVAIGRGPGCDVTLDDPRVSRRHATLDVSAGRVTVLDHGSTNGTTIDGEPVPRTGAPLVAGAVLRVGDSLLSVTMPAVPPATVVVRDGVVHVHRPPRPPRDAPVEVVDLPGSPTRERPHPVQWVAALVPALAAAGLAWATGSTVFLLVGLLSPAMLLSTAVGDRWQGRRARRRTDASVHDARGAAARALAAALVAETERRRAEHPDPAALALTASTPGIGLWARRPADPDWLVLRVGNGGVPSRTLVHESGRDRPAGMLTSVPVVVDLRAGPVGLAAPAPMRLAVARWWVAQLAVHHAPDDLSIVVLASDESWAWTRWLPHARIVATVTERADLLEQLAADVAHRVRRAGAGDTVGGPAVVLVVDDADRDTADPALLDVVARGAAVGVTAVRVHADEGSLPSGGTAVVVSGDGRISVTPPAGHGVHDAVADTVTGAWADQLARNLAPLVDAAGGPSGRVPPECTLTGLLGLGAADAADVARAWATSNGRPDTVLGRTADGVLRLDLDADGPHALVAGTTGSGKSELLRTLVAGLCLLHPPEELTVLLVDYKGGAAFAECAGLPHCAGLVTDLDPHLTARALRSLDAEIRRRELLLHDAGAADLSAYLAADGARPCPAPLARLVIVVDEFATLVEELPDFVAGLIGVAQRGRSLGVHLVLATQRPAAVVSPQIRANTNLRVALRVTEAGESVDVVGTDAAAAITPATPGRGVLRDGAGLRRFQTARPVRTPARPSAPRVTPLGPGRRPDPRDRTEPDGLAHLVDAARGAARTTRRPDARRPWLPPLGSRETTHGLPRAAFALADLPDQQRQQSMDLDLDVPSSTLLLGTARSGRTTALAAVALAAARSRSPREAEIHLVDARGALTELVGGLPHVATRLGPDDLELADALLRRLAEVTGPRRHLLVVDGWDVLVSALGDDALRVEHRLTTLLRAPGTVAVVVTGDRSLAAPRFGGMFDRRLVLRFADPADYGLLGLRTRDLPASFPPGRGIRAVDGVEFQIAVPAQEGSDRSEPAAAIRAAVAELSAVSPGGPPADSVRLRPLPTTVALDELGPAPPGRLRLGLGGDDAAVLTLDPFAGSRRWVVCGPPRSGRSGVLAVALVEAVRAGLPVLVAAPSRSPLAALADRLGVTVLDPAASPHVTAGPPPTSATLLLVDDTETFLDTDIGDALLARVRDTRAQVAVLAAGRPDELALAYRGLAAEVRRSRSGILLHPGPVDGELFGTRLTRAGPDDPPGRGRLVGDPAWRVGDADPSTAAEPVRIQVAVVTAIDERQSMWG